MQAVFEQLEFRLGVHDVVSVQRAATAAITVLTGSVWVTQEGSARDHVLSRGQTLRIDGDAPLVVAALAPAQVSISGPREPRGIARRWGRWVAAWYLRRTRRLRTASSALGGAL